MSPRAMSREQLEEALRVAQGEAEQYRRDALAWRWVERVGFETTDPSPNCSGVRCWTEAATGRRKWTVPGVSSQFSNARDAVEAAMRHEAKATCPEVINAAEQKT